jgi:hypothetical protein
MRRAAVATLGNIAEHCDGVRCDMAMLLMNAVFGRTWGKAAGPPPEIEYWVEVIQTVRDRRPDFLFMAEAYWDLEWNLQQQGFDYCYDKRLYDRLRYGNPESILFHLCADISYQRKMVRFIENHDEERSAHVFPGPKLRAAAVVAVTLPGAKLFHGGQFEGKRVRLPVQLGRRPDEPIDGELRSFSYRLLEAVRDSRFHEAEWQLCQCIGWPDNSSFRNLLAWSWRRNPGCCLIVVNFSDQSAQARVRWPYQDMAGAGVQLHDLLSGATYERDGNELRNSGLYVDLPPWKFHFLTFAEPASHSDRITDAPPLQL